MTFSNLWPLGFLILIPVIIILYLLKQKVKDQPFSSTMLWREIYKNLEAKTPFEKLKNNILMYLQILAMLLLILALMAPVIRNGGLVQRNTILVIDKSASMETAYGGGDSRLDEAVSRARRYLEGVNDSGMVTIVACGDEAEIIYQGQDKATAKRRLGELKTEQVSGNLDAASGMVGSLVSNLDNVDVVCYTDSDFDYESWKRNNDKISLAVESIYSKEENLSVDYVNYGLKDNTIEAICKVANHGTKPAASDVSLYLNNEIIDVQTVTVEAGESETVYFNEAPLPSDYIADSQATSTGTELDGNNILESGIDDENDISVAGVDNNTPAGGNVNITKALVLRAELSEKDALSADNFSSIQITADNSKKILLLSEGNVFMEKALSLVDGALVYKSEDISVLEQENDFELYVFDGINIPDDFDMSRLNKNAALLLINYKEDPFGLVGSNSDISDVMLHFDKSEITEYVEGYSFGVTNAYTYNLPEWASPIIAADDGSVVGYYGKALSGISDKSDKGSIIDAPAEGVHVNEGSSDKTGTGYHHIGVFGFDIHNTDLALQTEFPIFMSQLTEYLLTGNEELVEINNFPIDESEVIPIENVEVSGVLDKTKIGGRAIRNLLLFAAIIVLIVEWIIYHLQVHSGKKKQFLVVRAVLLAAIVLAISGVSITKRQRRIETIFLVDVSDSMSGNLAAVENYLKESMSLMPQKNQAGVVLFGKNTAVEQFVSDSKTFYGITASPVTTATNIESGVTSACSMFHDGVTKRLVLITDGCENEGSMRLAASNMKNSDVELYAISLSDSVSGSSEVYIDGLDTPSVIHAGDHYNISVSVKSNVETEALLSLYSGRISKGQKEIHLTKGTNQFVFEDVGEDGTIAQYKAVIEPDEDTITVNNTYVTFSQIEARPKVLLVEGKPGEASEYEKILTAANIGYDLTTGAGVPITLSQLNAYKAVITVDVYYDDLREGFAKTLETYVKDYSGGYICIGGENSYALGGYRNTELEEMLPVDMDIEGEKEIPKMAMVMVIDQSGSMAYPSEDNTSVTGLDLAKQAAISGVKELRETDEAGVLAFDDAYSWTVPITKVDDVDEITDKIRTIGDGGGTSIYPALEEAYARILKSDAKIKHIILLTDGQDEFRQYNVLLDQINKAGITVSTVAVGKDSDRNMLKTIADTCGGRFYYTDVNNSIPRIFAQEVYLSTNTYLINEEFYPVVTSNNEILSGVMEEGCPALLGYIATRAKPRADVILKSPKGDPILSAWQFGLGRTVAWSSDATNEWTAPFAAWENYPMLWSNIIHYVISDTELGGDNLEIVKDGNSAKVVYETDEYDKNTVLTALVSDENGEADEITLDPVKPGSYEASVDSEDIGIYSLSVRKKNGDEIVKNYNTAFANQYSPEYQFSEASGELERFVKQVDGTELSFEDDVWKTDVKKVKNRVPLTMLLIIISMGILLFDIIIRRFSVDVAGGLKRAVSGGINKVKGVPGVVRTKKDNDIKAEMKIEVADDKSIKPKTEYTQRDVGSSKSGEDNVNMQTDIKTNDMSIKTEYKNTVSMTSSAGNSTSNKNNTKSKKKDNRKSDKNKDTSSQEKLDMNALLQKKKDRN
ncbi:MAG: VWA domain-containing protein [Lachnospiraceae bacterium]|nr:VWA domain-containing protein [Lachnospiraceae bacterium]